MRPNIVQTHSNFGKVDVDGLVLKMWIRMANISINRKEFVKR